MKANQMIRCASAVAVALALSTASYAADNDTQARPITGKEKATAMAKSAKPITEPPRATQKLSFDCDRASRRKTFNRATCAVAICWTSSTTSTRPAKWCST